MKYILFVFIMIGILVGVYDTCLCQDLKSPTDFLGYPLGSKFTYHHKVLDYFEYVANGSDRVKLFQYGETYERRELKVAYISSPENLKNLEEIRKNNLGQTGLLNGEKKRNDIVIVWLSYNVHGNEANSTETSMKVLYKLANKDDSDYHKWLEKLLIILDPCLNPDGRDRYTNWYNQVSNRTPNPNINVREHHENWAHGRSNHYLFDLNRDWVWQTQMESKQRLALYNDWMPQVHVDFHEQLYNSQYYFAPAAQPLHESITDWQKEFQEIVGKNNAAYFDEKGWIYFTDETFDLLYPGYGDTYPTFNGAIGMTYEMPGHSKAGLAITTEKGDTLTLANRIEMHFTTTMSTLESCYENRISLLNEFSNYFNETQRKDTYYVLRSKTPDRIAHLTELLDKNKIEYKSPASAKKIKAYAYSNDEILSVDIRKGDLIIPQDQPKSKLVTVLFERNTKLTDTLTYDITAWSLPFVYGLDAYQVHGKMDLADYHPEKHLTMKPDRVPYAFLLNWTSISDAKFLSAILNDGYKVNYSTKSFQREAINYNPGTLIITRNDNEEKWDSNFDKLWKTVEAFDRNLIPVYSGSLNSSMNIGSQKINFLQKPKIAMLSGDGISTLHFGELWYFFEQEINYPIDIINKSTIGEINIADYDVMILASGKYPALQNETGFEKLDKWIKDGGNLILIEEAINEFIGDNKFSIEKNDPTSNEENEKQPILYAFEENERENLKKYIKGGIIKIDLDNTHPLVYGYENHYYTLKDNGNYYKFLQDGWNVGYISSDDKVIAGFVGSEMKKKLNKNLVFGVEQRERGKVIYVADNPLFRAFWQNGKLLMANAIFFNN